MNAAELEARYAERTIIGGGRMTIVRPEDAAALIADARSHGIHVLGMDAFWVKGRSIQPDMSLDSAAWPPGQDWDLALAYLAEVGATGVAFEVYLSDEPPPNVAFLEPSVAPRDERGTFRATWQNIGTAPVLAATLSLIVKPGTRVDVWDGADELEVNGMRFDEHQEFLYLMKVDLPERSSYSLNLNFGNAAPPSVTLWSSSGDRRTLALARS